MKKVIFAVFAHPDDETFGPCGTLHAELQAGSEVHLVTLTNGEAGSNPDNHRDLGAVRSREWQDAGKIIGFTSMKCFGYADSKLCNSSMEQIGNQLIDYLKSVLRILPPDVEVEVMSMDLNGITGHIDHIIAGRASCYAFYKLKPVEPRLKRIRLTCIPSSEQPSVNTEWLFMEPGRRPEEIDQVVDATKYRETVISAIEAHHSQREDGQKHIEQRGNSLGKDYFIIRT